MEQTAPLLALDSEDKATVVALMVRLLRVQEERNRISDIKKQVDEQHLAVSMQWNRCRDALAIVGFDVHSKTLWDDVKTAVGADEWNAAFSRARSNPLPQTMFLNSVPFPLPPPPPPPAPPLIEEHTERLDGEADEADEQIDGSFEEAADTSQSVREYTVEALKAAPWGLKATDIRAAYEATRNTKLHDKTIGMTLYRLSKETPPLTRREGRTWFFVAPSAETKNPGGDTPGLNETGN